MRRRRLLDLFSCAGLAGDGYDAAGWDVYAVDNDPAALRHNPHRQHCGDAIKVLRRLLAGHAVPFVNPATGAAEWLMLSDFDAIHASPPCQLYSATRRLADAQGKGKGRAVDLLGPTMALLRRTGLPWVVENVERSPLRYVEGVVRLCGSSFGLKVQRHRLFVSEWFDLQGKPCRHTEAFDRVTVYRNADGRRYTRATPRAGKPRPWGVYYAKGDSIPSGGRTVRTLEGGHYVMGVRDRVVPWRYLCEGLPPVYTQHLGRLMLDQLDDEAAA